MLLCDTDEHWGSKCLTYNRHQSGRPLTYEERVGYIYDAEACGQGVHMYILDERVNMLHDELRYKLDDVLHLDLPKFGTKESREFWDKHKKEEEEHLAKNPNFTNEDFSHGTFVAGVARRVAKNADIISFLSAGDFEVETDLIIKAREMAVKRKTKIMQALAEVTRGTRTLQGAKAIIRDEMDLVVTGKEYFTKYLAKLMRGFENFEKAGAIIEAMTEMGKETIPNALAELMEGKNLEGAKIITEKMTEMVKDTITNALAEVMAGNKNLEEAKSIIEKMTEMTVAGKETIRSALENMRKITRAEAGDIMMKTYLKREEAMTKALVETMKFTDAEARDIMKKIYLKREEDMTKALVETTKFTDEEAMALMLEMAVLGKEVMTEALVEATQITHDEAEVIAQNVMETAVTERVVTWLEAKTNVLVNTTIKTTFEEAKVIIEKVLEVRPIVLNLSSVLQETLVVNIVRLIKAGVHVVIAAGNHNLPDNKDRHREALHEDDKKYIDDIIFVGASTRDDKIWGYSNDIVYDSGSAYGSRVDVFAPGSFIRGAIHSDSKDGLRAMRTWNGTSYAAPHVTGIVACLLSHPEYKDFTPRQMKAKIIDMAWEDAIQSVDNLYLVKKVLAFKLGEALWRLRSDTDTAFTSDDLKRLFKETGKSMVTEAYLDRLWQELNLLDGKTDVDMAGFKGILGNIGSVGRKIASTMTRVPLTVEDFAATTVQDFKTTRRLASCHVHKWNDKWIEEDFQDLDV